MTLEQVVLTMINDKMLDNGQISEKLHSSIQKDITIIGLEPHPEDKKNGAYDRISLSDL